MDCVVSGIWTRKQETAGLLKLKVHNKWYSASHRIHEYMKSPSVEFWERNFNAALQISHFKCQISNISQFTRLHGYTISMQHFTIQPGYSGNIPVELRSAAYSHVIRRLRLCYTFFLPATATARNLLPARDLPPAICLRAADFRLHVYWNPALSQRKIEATK